MPRSSTSKTTKATAKPARARAIASLHVPTVIDAMNAPELLAPFFRGAS